ncbi:hypothetical protein [Kribbella swartbergensis]
MVNVVLRVRLVSGDQFDVSYEDPGAVDDEDAVEHAVAALTDDGGVLRCRHGGRLVVLFARGVAALEVAPRGAVL